MNPENLVSLIFLSNLIYSGNASPLPKSSPDPQFPGPLPSRSSQQFTMYKPIQLQYNAPQPYPPDANVRRDRNGNPLLPLFQYNYNITHPWQSQFPQSQSQSPKPGSGIVLSHNQIQYLTQQQGDPVQLQYQRQFQQNPNYAPVIISNPDIIRHPQFEQPLPLSQNLNSNSQRNSAIAQFLVDSDPGETDPEQEEIGFRNFGKNPRARTNSAGSRIVFDQGSPDQQLLNRVAQYQDTNRRQNQLGGPSSIQFGDNSLGYESTTRPPIQVPYITTPSALKRIMQLQKNPQTALAGFRSQLGLVNPASLQASSLANLDRNSALNLSPAVRAARIQNLVVPLSYQGQTPAGTQLLHQNRQELQNLQNAVANNAYAIQRTQNPYAPINLSSPSLQLLRGVAITPENQRNIGQFLFADPNNIANINANAVVASTAQKVFILPRDGPVDTENSINYEETPSEIVITVVDEDPAGAGAQGERGKVLTNFSLFIMPSTYRKCVEGYRRAHDGKCRLVIKLRGRNQGLGKK